MTRPAARRVVLVGFMGAGKSTVGPLLARRLGWRFIDVDARVEEREGRSVADIFRTDGEPAFRRMEAEAAREALARDRVVVAAGGGWAAAPGRLEELPPGTASVWLRVGAEEAVRRAGGAPGSRPLLAGDDPLAAAADLLRRRSPRYAVADLAVDTEGRFPVDVADEIADLLTPRHPRT